MGGGGDRPDPEGDDRGDGDDLAGGGGWEVFDVLGGEPGGLGEELAVGGGTRVLDGGGEVGREVELLSVGGGGGGGEEEGGGDCDGGGEFWEDPLLLEGGGEGVGGERGGGGGGDFCGGDGGGGFEFDGGGGGGEAFGATVSDGGGGEGGWEPEPGDEVGGGDFEFEGGGEEVGGGEGGGGLELGEGGEDEESTGGGEELSGGGGWLSFPPGDDDPSGEGELETKELSVSAESAILLSLTNFVILWLFFFSFLPKLSIVSSPSSFVNSTNMDSTFLSFFQMLIKKTNYCSVIYSRNHTISITTNYNKLNLHTKKTKLNSEGTNLNQTKTMGEKMKPGLCVKSENKSWELDQNAWIRMVMMSHFQRG